MSFKHCRIVFIIVFLICLTAVPALAQQAFDSGWAMPKVDFDFDTMERQPLQGGLQILIMLSLLTVVPYILISCTAFIRISITLSFIKTSLGATHSVPKQVWVGFALMLNLFIMAPVLTQIDQQAMQPFLKKQITYNQFIVNVQKPMLDFMKKNTRINDLKLFVSLSKPKDPVKALENPSFLPLVAAFILSEMKTGFYVGFITYLPFLCIDMITAATLMAMGMFMVSPMTFALPCKIYCFVMIDGFELLCQGLAEGYRY